MAERELKKMNRSELIEIIYAQQKEEHELRDKIKQLEEKLTEKNIILEKSGSIAEASLRLNKIFEDAQAAADQYVESVRAKVNDERFSNSTNKYYKGENDTKENVINAVGSVLDNIDTYNKASENFGDNVVIVRENEESIVDRASDVEENAESIVDRASDVEENAKSIVDRASYVEENAESIVDSTLDVDKNSVGTVGNALNTEEKTPDNNELIVKMEEEIPVVNPEKIVGNSDDIRKNDRNIYSGDTVKSEEHLIENKDENDALENLFNSIEKKLQSELMSFDNIEGEYEKDMFRKRRNRYNDKQDIYNEESQIDENDIFSEIGNDMTNINDSLKNSHSEEDIFKTVRNNQMQSIDIFDDITDKRTGKASLQNSKNSQNRKLDIYNQDSNKRSESIDIFDDITEATENNNVVYPNKNRMSNVVAYPNKNSTSNDVAYLNTTAINHNVVIASQINEIVDIYNNPENNNSIGDGFSNTTVNSGIGSENESDINTNKVVDEQNKLKTEEDAGFKYYDQHHKNRHVLNNYSDDSIYNSNRSVDDNDNSSLDSDKGYSNKSGNNESGYSSGIMSNYDYFNMWFQQSEKTADNTNTSIDYAGKEESLKNPSSVMDLNDNEFDIEFIDLD